MMRYHSGNDKGAQRTNERTNERKIDLFPFFFEKKKTRKKTRIRIARLLIYCCVRNMGERAEVSRSSPSISLILAAI